MNTQELKVYAQIQALVIQAKGMEATNQNCVMEGRIPYWEEHNFKYISDEILALSASLDPSQDTPVQPIQYDSNFTAEDPC